MAKNLRAAYKEVFKAMYADALENRDEAAEIRQTAENAFEEEKGHLAELEETARICKENFASQGRVLRTSARTVQSLEVLTDIANNITRYVSSIKKIPEVEENVSKKREELATCKHNLMRAEADISAIRHFLTEGYDEDYDEEE